MNEYKDILTKYLPAPAVDPVYHLFEKHRVNLVITRERRSKHGDFRPGINGNPSRISINHNLNPYAFLITFLHELAHQLVWEKYHRKVKPHGPEWKQTFYGLLQPFCHAVCFPQEIIEILNPADKRIFASTTSDTRLARALKKYDRSNGMNLMENLPENAEFRLPDGRRFKKLQKRRKNYLCLCLNNKRQYVFNPLAEVIPVENPEK
ncbi:MAG: hypothetical protein ACLFPE_03705 [Bacteroidales bacterium]